jgi:hypothetical protein
MHEEKKGVRTWQTNCRDIGFGKEKKTRHQYFLTMTFAYSPAFYLLTGRHRRSKVSGKDSQILLPEEVFLNVNGAQESIPRNEFRQPM